jgi:trk system potassium uptake protein TrkA
MMKIIIAGAGRIGYSIAQELAKENHDITVIEQNEIRLKDVSNNLDVLTYHGDAAGYDILVEAGVKDADLLIAVTRDDAVNLLCCLAARKMGVRHTIARVRNNDYLRQTVYLKDELGLSMTINPEEETANEISRILRFPIALKVESFANSKAETVEIKVVENSGLCNVKLSDLRSKFGDVLVCAAKRGAEVFIPRGDFVIQAGDRLNVIGSAKEINKFIDKISSHGHAAKKVMVFGGGTTAYYLAKQLVNTDISLKIIEKTKEGCAVIKDAFPKVNVVYGNGNNPELLGEEGLKVADAFVATTGDDDDNVITSMYAMSLGVGRVITKIKESHIVKMLSNNQLDSIIQPSSIATQRVVRYVRSMQNAYDDSGIDALYYLFDMDVEILELRIKDTFKFANIPLKDLSVSHDALIAAIIRKDKCIVPSGDDVIQADDSVIVSTTRSGVVALEDLVEAR